MPVPTAISPTVSRKAAPGSQPAPVHTCRIVNTYPHDADAYTQGLVYAGGTLYEGTGRHGASSLREVELETGRVVRSIALPGNLFGEGIAVVGDRIVQLTWRSNVGLVYDRRTFELLFEFYYPTEGWGLTYDGDLLIMSDGTSTLHYLDPETFEDDGRLNVRDGDVPIAHLNELEYVGDELLANVWTTDRIARIDPSTGQVIGWIDLTGLLDGVQLDQPVDVLNGIAFDTETGRLFVTGKLWPVLFEIELVAAVPDGDGG